MKCSVLICKKSENVRGNKHLFEKQKIENNNNKTNRTAATKFDCYFHLSLSKPSIAQPRVTKNSVWECMNAKICLSVCVCVCVHTVSKSRSYVGANQHGLCYSIHTPEYHNYILNCAILCKCKSVHGYILLKLKSIIKKLSKIRINCSALVYLDVIFEKVSPTPDLAF